MAHLDPGEVGTVKSCTVIGLEVHVALATQTKLFCRCSTQWKLPKNTAVCPICLGHPGTLPALNRRAVELAVVAALALGCEVNKISSFDRKNYFYPDLPKGYQVTQHQQPLAHNGRVKFQSEAAVREIAIRQVHIEEDAARLYHHQQRTDIDFNRAGIPLVEIVTEPELSCPRDARMFLEELRLLLIAAGVSDCRMEAGNMRCDANISFGADGRRTEIKNLNSLKAVQLALEYQQRQGRVDSSQDLTVRWDERNKRTVPMRSKSEPQEYMYIPEPDLPALCIDESLLSSTKRQLPETPLMLTQRLEREYGIDARQARVLAADREAVAWFEHTVAAGAPAEKACNWLLGPVFQHLKATGGKLGDLQPSPEHLASLIELDVQQMISNTEAREILRQMLETGQPPAQIKDNLGLGRRRDEKLLRETIDEVLATNSGAVSDYKSGKDRARGFLVGKVMQQVDGNADPAEVDALLRELLDR